MSARPAAPRFELSGGALCLDFANTWGDRGRPETEQLRDYADLVAFSEQAGALERGAARALRGEARHRARRADAAFARAVALREALYRIFSARARGRAAADDDLAPLNDLLPEALGRLRVVAGDGGFAWRSEPGAELDAALWPIARSAAELLTSDELPRVCECDGERCTWLFLDRSRNRSRRWCSMDACGNRAKARRHRRRKAG